MTSFETGASVENIVKKASSNVTLKAWPIKSRSHTCCTRESLAREILPRKPVCPRLTPDYAASFDVEMSRKREEILQVLVSLLKKYRVVKNLICHCERDIRIYLNYV